MFFDLYSKFIDRIEQQYPTPISTEFREMRFGMVKWSKAEHRNFFTIIKVLAERGSSTINEIVEADDLSQQFKHKYSRYITYRRVILGDKKAHVTGLIEKGAVVASKAKNKLHKKYELSHNGIFYAIKMFMDLEIAYSGNYKRMLKMDSKVGWYDYSKQIEFPIKIIYYDIHIFILMQNDYLQNEIPKSISSNLLFLKSSFRSGSNRSLASTALIKLFNALSFCPLYKK